MDVEPVEMGAVGGDPLMHQPDLAEEGVGQTGEAGGQGGLVRHRLRVIERDTGPARRQQHEGPR